MAKPGRNDPCPCGSGNKYKKCCLAKEEAVEREQLAEADANAAADLVRAGKLDEAEQAARDLLLRFPNVHDGWDRLGMVYEQRGGNKQAADSYRKVIELIRQHPDDYDAGFEDVFTKLIAKLDPLAAG
jgi:Tfp pilus assembly protein PilF